MEIGNEQPKVSIVITTFKREAIFLKRCIDSIVDQTYKNIEIIIVDDNPGDNALSKEIITDLLPQYDGLIYIKHTINQGAQVSRNDGIKKSTGELVAFLDDDDEWMEEKLCHQVSLYLKTENCGMVYCKGISRYEQEDGSYIDKPYITANNFSEEVSFDDLLYADRIGTTSQALIKKSVFEEVGYFDLNQPARQDYELWIRISKKFRCVGVNEFLFVHYIHVGQQISKNHKKAIIGIQNIYKKNIQEYKRNHLAAAHIKYVEMRYYWLDRSIPGVVKCFFIAVKELLYTASEKFFRKKGSKNVENSDK